MNRIRWYGPTVALLIVALMVMLIGPGLTRNLAHVHKAEELRLVRNALDENGALAELSNAFQQVAEVVKPSVVSITVMTRESQRPTRTPDLRRFFGPRMFPDPRREQPDDEPRENDEEMEKYNVPHATGAGSGWVFDRDGHIVTNNHVITGRDHTTLADEIVVSFADGSKHEATVVATDRKTDIAVLKIKGDSYHPARVAEKPVKQGEIVFAFGSPFRYDFSMSQGIVSAKGREIGILLSRQGYENFIQTDAAINPGNSGGPLTNIYGQVVGMNTLITSTTGAFNGLGFAIPADIIQDVVTQLIEKGQVSRGYLGISIKDLAPDMAKTYGYTGKGVLVVEPKAGTPAEKAGIQSDDIITKVDGTPVEDTQHLRFMVAGKGPGATVELELFRDGKIVTKTVELAEATDEMLAAAGFGAEEPGDIPDQKEQLILRKLGLESVQTFTEDLAARMRVRFVAGVLVAEVRPGSAAYDAGLGPNTIITHVMRDKISSVAELTEALEKYTLTEGVRVRILVRNRRTGKLSTSIVLLKLPEE